MKTKAFVYTQMQNSASYGDVLWNNLNKRITEEPGSHDKTAEITSVGLSSPPNTQIPISQTAMNIRAAQK